MGPVLLRAVLAAVVAAVLTHLLFTAAGADFVVEPTGQDRRRIGPFQVALATLLLTALGGGAAELLARRSRRPARAFLALVAVVLVLMAVNPLVAAEQPLTVVALEVEHLVAAAAALVFLLPPLRARQRGSS